MLQSRFADQVSAEFRQNHHLIVVGLPAQLPLLEDMNSSMPAPFEVGENFADEHALPVSYRLPADASVGYLELFPAPWNQERAVLTILGSTPQAVQWAGQSLIVSELRGQLANNLALIQEHQIVVGDTVVPATQLPTITTDTAVITTPITTTTDTLPITAPITIPSSPPPTQSSWILPTLIGSSALMGLILLIVLISTLWNYRRSRQSQKCTMI